MALTAGLEKAKLLCFLFPTARAGKSKIRVVACNGKAMPGDIL